MAGKFDREAILGRLAQIKYEPESGQGMQADKVSLSGALLTLVEVNHEREYEACRGAAMHLLGAINEPEDIVLE